MWGNRVQFPGLYFSKSVVASRLYGMDVNRRVHIPTRNHHNTKKWVPPSDGRHSLLSIHPEQVDLGFEKYSKQGEKASNTLARLKVPVSLSDNNFARTTVGIYCSTTQQEQGFARWTLLESTLTTAGVCEQKKLSAIWRTPIIRMIWTNRLRCSRSKN